MVTGAQQQVLEAATTAATSLILALEVSLQGHLSDEMIELARRLGTLTHSQGTCAVLYVLSRRTPGGMPMQGSQPQRSAALHSLISTLLAEVERNAHM
jgi:hypothetical protein